MSPSSDALNAFVETIRTHDKSDFYRNQWGANRSFSTLPFTNRADLVRVPLSRRRYKNEKSLVKIVHTEWGSFLSEWGFPDIQKERYGTHSSRPMVYLVDSHDALEKALWCYEQGMVPALGEKNVAVTESIATKYRIDSLVCDMPSLRALEPYLRNRDTKLQSLSILGTAFPTEELIAFAPYVKSVRLVLALPETGAFAEASLDKHPLFTPHPECFIEDAGGLALTKLSLFATPLVRYKTSICIEVVRTEGEQCVEFALV